MARPHCAAGPNAFPARSQSQFLRLVALVEVAPKSLILWMEATPGIEPGFTVLQTVASPLRHVAIPGRGLYQMRGSSHNGVADR